MPETIHIGSDHGGVVLKSKVSAHLAAKGYTVNDIGTSGTDSVDYPLYAQRVCREVLENGGLGILVCGTGLGMSMTANRFSGIRAAMCTNEYMARMAKRHNDANVLCLGERNMGQDLALSVVDAFLSEAFEGGRHQRRIDLIDNLPG